MSLLKPAKQIILGSVLFLLVQVAFDCASSTYMPKYYSRENLTFQKLPELYENVPFFKDSLVRAFMVELAYPDVPDHILDRGIVGTVVVHPLIDREGQVEAVYVKQPVHPVLDSLAVETVRKSRFKTFREVTGRDGKYSLIIPMGFYDIFEKKLRYFFRQDSTQDSSPE